MIEDSIVKIFDCQLVFSKNIDFYLFYSISVVVSGTELLNGLLKQGHQARLLWQRSNNVCCQPTTDDYSVTSALG